MQSPRFSLALLSLPLTLSLLASSPVLAKKKRNTLQRIGRSINSTFNNTISKPVEKSVETNVSKPVAKNFEANKNLYGKVLRVSACSVTACLSEVNRAQQIEAEKEKLNRDLEAYQNDKLNAERSQNLKQTEELRQEMIRNLEAYLKNLQEVGLAQGNERLRQLNDVHLLITSEIEARSQEKALGQVRARKQSVQALANLIESTLKNGDSSADVENLLNVEIQNYAGQLNATFDSVYQETLRWLEDDSLQAMKDRTGRVIEDLGGHLATIETDIVLRQAELETLRRESSPQKIVKAD